MEVPCLHVFEAVVLRKPSRNEKWSMDIFPAEHAFSIRLLNRPLRGQAYYAENSSIVKLSAFLRKTRTLVGIFSDLSCSASTFNARSRPDTSEMIPLILGSGKSGNGSGSWDKRSIMSLIAHSSAPKSRSINPRLGRPLRYYITIPSSFRPACAAFMLLYSHREA